jgi:cell division protein FtsW (lipid II flippase)
MQPSEVMKVILVVVLAGYIRYGHSHRTFRGLFGPFALTLVPVLLIMKQPDLGTALLFVPVLFVMLYVAGAQPRHLGVVAGLGLLAGVFLYATPGLLNEYQKNRVRAFLLQGKEDTDLRRGLGHQNYVSRIVAGTATTFGTGTGEETREAVRDLSESHSDFIYPVILSAFGLAGGAGVLLLYALLVWLMLHTALRVREPSGRLLAVGVAALIAGQSLINAAMALGLLPIVGMPLPFLSAGGSSLMTSFIGLGLVLNVGADNPIEFGRGDFD